MKRPVPPYLPFRTFTDFLVKLRSSNGMPAQIDKSLMEEKSPSIQSQLLNCLRYLALVDERNMPTSDLHELVQLIEAKKEKRYEGWENVLRKAYPDLFELNLRKATTLQIRDSLLRQGLKSQDTLDKGVNFFSQAVKAAGIDLSPNIRPYSGRRKSRRRRRTRNDERQGALNFHSPTETLSMTTNGLSAWEQLVEKLPNFNESWPVELQKYWLQNYEKLLDMQRKIRTRNGRDPSK